jgi:clan AA aspartic protease
MISGIVTSNREAVIRVVVRGPEGREQERDAVIDTGFNDFLTLPPSIVGMLEPPFAAPAEATLADGSVVQLNYHRASVIWDGESRDMLVLAAESGPLVGMSMLYGYDFFMQAMDGGRVTIERHG